MTTRRSGAHYRRRVVNERNRTEPRQAGNAFRNGESPPDSMFRAIGIDVLIGVAVGILSGIGSAAFLHTLTWATNTRTYHPALVWFLPAAGLLIGMSYHYLGGESKRGANLVFDEMNAPDQGAPQRMAPMVLVGAALTHLFGGSGGREGAAVQIAAGLSTPLRKWIPSRSRPSLLIAAVAGGFGSVFGVPFAGTLFAVEVPRAGGLFLPTSRFRKPSEEAPLHSIHPLVSLVPAACASFVGDRITRALGISHHRPPPFVALNLSPGNIARLVTIAVAFGILSMTFIEATHGVKRLLTRLISYPPARLFVGGGALLLLVGLGNLTHLHPRDYLGLSLPLIDSALSGVKIVAIAFLMKLLFTSITIGSGFPGGEVTPLFCMGACLGSVLSDPLGIDRISAVGLGYVVVFAAASNTPLACSILAVELFGTKMLIPILICTLIATLVKGRRSVYASQRFPVRVKSGL
jgi:H+/Cl- antiporter ClcA